MVVVGGGQDLVAGPVLPGLVAVPGSDGVRSEPAGGEQPGPGGVVDLGDVALRTASITTRSLAGATTSRARSCCSVLSRWRR